MKKSVYLFEKELLPIYCVDTYNFSIINMFYIYFNGSIL